MVCIQKADIFMFDEPSSYLDVKQRLNAATAIRNLIEATKYVIVVEHDLAVLGKFWRFFKNIFSSSYESYLDVKQRPNAATAIRNLIEAKVLKI